jgi:hypothetical protein
MHSEKPPVHHETQVDMFDGDGNPTPEATQADNESLPESVAAFRSQIIDHDPALYGLTTAEAINDFIEKHTNSSRFTISTALAQLASALEESDNAEHNWQKRADLR